MEIRLATREIQKDSIVDGEGIRSVIWTQGCRHHCKGCHNPTTHAFNKGIVVNTESLKQEIMQLESQDGVTFSGGDPMEQPEACNDIASFCQKQGLNVWCYTGYTFEELLEKGKQEKAILDFLENIDVLVDGRFILEEKSYDAIFRGSKNQRIIDVPKSLKEKKTVLVAKYLEKESYKKPKRTLYV